MIYRINIPLSPVPAARPRVTRSGRVYYPKTYSSWKSAAAKLLPACLFDAGLFRKLVGPLLVSLVCRVTRPKTTKLEHPKPDVDNYAKAVLDACNGLAWVDDEQVIGLVVVKEWAEPGAEGEIDMSIKELDAAIRVRLAPQVLLMSPQERSDYENQKPEGHPTRLTNFGEGQR